MVRLWWWMLGLVITSADESTRPMNVTTKNVTLHIPITLSMDNFQHLSIIDDTISNINYCFAELLITIDQANKSIHAWEGALGDIGYSGSNAYPLPHALSNPSSKEFTNDVAARLICATIGVVDSAAKKLEKKCGRRVIRTVIAVQSGNPVSDSLLLDVFKVPLKQLGIAPLVMWKNAISFVLGIYLAKSNFVMHLDGDWTVSSKMVDPNGTMINASSAPIFVDLALDLFEAYPRKVSAVVMPGCQDGRRGYLDWKKNTKAFSANKILQRRQIPFGLLYQRFYKHKTVGRQWYYEQKGESCGRSIKLQPNAISCKQRKDLSSHRKIFTCGETRNFISTQAFIVQVDNTINRLRQLRIKDIKYPWRSQIECIFEHAAVSQAGTPNSAHIFVHPDVSGICKTYPHCYKLHHRKMYSVDYSDKIENCTMFVTRKEAIAKNESWRPCIRWFVNKTHPVPGCSIEPPSAAEAIANLTRDVQVRATYEGCLRTAEYSKILGSGWTNGE